MLLLSCFSSQSNITSQIILSSLPLNFIFHGLLFVHICSRSRKKFINSVADLNKSTTHLVEKIYLKIKKAVETLINWKIFHPQLFSFPFLKQDKVFPLVTLKKLFSCKKNKNHQLGIINSIRFFLLLLCMAACSIEHKYGGLEIEKMATKSHCGVSHKV